MISVFWNGKWHLNNDTDYKVIKKRWYWKNTMYEGDIIVWDE